MAKLDSSLTFKNAYISLEDNTIIEHLKDEEIEHTLSDVLYRFKDTPVNITIKEAKEIVIKDVE